MPGVANEHPVSLEDGVAESAQGANPNGQAQPVPFDAPLNFFSLVLYKVDVSAPVAAFVWALSGLIFVCCEILCLAAIAISTSWSLCTEVSDCKLGQACITSEIAFSGTSGSSCEDCHMLHPHKLWYDATLVNTYDGPAGNATDYCARQLPHAAVLLPGTHDFRLCLYAQLSLAHVSPLEIIIIVIAFAIVSASVVNDRQQQLCTQQLRRAAPLGQAATRKSGLQRVAVLQLALTELLCHAVLLPFIPYSTVMLMVNMGITAAPVLLNGVAIAFVLSFDDLAAND